MFHVKTASSIPAVLSASLFPRRGNFVTLPGIARISPLIITSLLAGCTDGPGTSFPAGAYPPVEASPKPALIPFADLEFKVTPKRDEIRILITASKWQIVGLGAGTKNNEILLSSIGGVKNSQGSSKLQVEKRLPEIPTTVVLLDPRGTRHVIGTF